MRSQSLLDAKLKMESRVQMSDVMVERLREIVLAPAAQPSKYHPSSRLLALTILGQIDQKPAVTSGGKTDPAVPHPEAFKALVNAFRGANKEGSFADAFLIGALVGLERHAKEASKSWDAATKSGLAKLLADQLVGEPPAIREPAVHIFVQRRMLETLMTFDTPEHAPAKRFIIDQLKNKDADSNLRLLCLFQLPKASKSIQPDELDALSTSVVHFLKHEVKKWDDSIKDPAQMGMMVVPWLPQVERDGCSW